MKGGYEVLDRECIMGLRDSLYRILSLGLLEMFGVAILIWYTCLPASVYLPYQGFGAHVSQRVQM